MKEIYEKLLTLLLTIPEIKWVDLERGQLEEERPSVLYPCALVTMRTPRCEDLDHKKTQQACTANITIRLAFDYMGNTSAVTPEVERAKSLAYYELADKVFDTLQGYTDSNINELTRRGQDDEPRRDKIKVLQIQFVTEFIQRKN